MHCIESTKSHQRAVVKSKSVIQPDVLGTRKGTAFTTRPTRPSMTKDNIYEENNRTLIRKLAENRNVAADNKILKVQVAKLEFELALANNKIRQLENQQDEWAASRREMGAKQRIPEQANLRLVGKKSKSSRVIEANKDRLLEVISFLSSDKTATDSIDNVLENNLTGFEDKNTEILRLLAESKMEISKPSVIQQASSDFGNPPVETTRMTFQQNSCFPIAEPLPGKKRTFEDVAGRAIPPSVRKLLPPATSSNRSAAEQPTNASEIQSVTNGRSLSVSPTYGRPVSSSRLGCSASKIPVRVSNGPFAAETEPNEMKNMGFKSKIPIRVKTMNHTFPQREDSISKDVSSESRPSVKTVLPSANVVASKIPVRVATSKKIVSDNKPNVTSELQQSLADNKLKSKIPVRSTRSSAERQAFNKVVNLQKSNGSSCGLACNCRISPPSIGSSRGRNFVK